MCYFLKIPSFRYCKIYRHMKQILLHEQKNMIDLVNTYITALWQFIWWLSQLYNHLSCIFDGSVWRLMAIKLIPAQLSWEHSVHIKMIRNNVTDSISCIFTVMITNMVLTDSLSFVSNIRLDRFGYCGMKVEIRSSTGLLHADDRSWSVAVNTSFYHQNICYQVHVNDCEEGSLYKQLVRICLHTSIALIHSTLYLHNTHIQLLYIDSSILMW